LSAQLQVNAAPSKPSVGSADTTSVGVAVCPICLTCYDGTSKDKCVADGADLRHDFKGVSPVMAGRYCLERLVGGGGMGAVFRAYDSKLSRRVAIKVLHGGLASGGEFRDRFVVEATVFGRLG